jgi:4-amino-4-deoxy-L-arabinose transferase-like glycosyltransferase
VAPRKPAATLARLLVHPLAGPAILVLTCLVTLLLNLGHAALFDPDEGRHAEIAREILVSGHWLTPTLDFAPYHEKPILFYWLAALAMKLLGVNEWAARLPSALAACATVAVTAWWGARFLDRLTGVLAGLLLATAGAYVVLGRLVVVDMTLTWWIAAAFFYGAAWLLEGGALGWPIWPFYALIGVATLTKGPVAIVLAVLTFGLFVARPGLSRRLRRFRLWQGLAILFAVAGTWYVTAALVAPAYMWEFLWTNNVQRFLAGSGGHRSNPFAYLYLLPLIFLPWSLFLPSVVLHNRDAPRRTAPRSIEFCTVWVAVVFVFFSLSKGKLATYLLPLFPPLALLTADALGPFLKREPLRRGQIRNESAALWALAALLLAAPVVGYVFLHEFAPDHAALAALPAVGLPFVATGRYGLRRGRHDLAVGSVFAVTVVAFFCTYQFFPPALNDVYSLRRPAQLLSFLPPDGRVISYHARAHSLRFYSNRNVQPVESGKLAAELLAEAQPTALLIKRRSMRALRCALAVDVYGWWEGERAKTLIVNRPPPAAAGVDAVRIAPLGPAACPQD